MNEEKNERIGQGYEKEESSWWGREREGRGVDSWKMEMQGEETPFDSWHPL